GKSALMSADRLSVLAPETHPGPVDATESEPVSAGPLVRAAPSPERSGAASWRTARRHAPESGQATKESNHGTARRHLHGLQPRRDRAAGGHLPALLPAGDRAADAAEGRRVPHARTRRARLVHLHPGLRLRLLHGARRRGDPGPLA